MKRAKSAKKLKLQISITVLLFLSITLSAVIIFSPISIQQIARAVTGNYLKNTGDPLDVSDWNNLPSDFLDKTATDSKDGDLTMNSGNINMNSGNINMGNNSITNLIAPSNNNDAANRQYVDSKINHLTEGNIRVVCGVTSPGATGWFDETNNRIVAQINTSAAGFSAGSNVSYFTTIAGLGFHLDTTGANSIYQSAHDYLRVKVRYIGSFTPFDAAQAEAWQWHIYWCGYGN